MKSWILPAVAVGAVVFLMTKPGRELQETIADNFGDWSDNLIRSSRRMQQTLQNASTTLNRFSHALEQVAD